MNRKTKRNSPPPLHTTTADVLDKYTDLGFAKWSKMLQLISPPNKKRRAIALIGRSSLSSESSDDEEEDNDSSDEEEEEEEEQNKQQCVYSTTVIERVHKDNDASIKQKMLHRRAMYIPNPVYDGPRDARHKWTLYRATYQKLRKNTLPLSESLHLKRMLVTLQKDKSIQQQTMELPRQSKLNQEDEDDIPLGTLLEKNKRQPTLATTKPAFDRKRAPSPPLSKSAAAFYQRRPVMPNLSVPQPVAFSFFYRQPCYYYNAMPVQFL